MQPRGIVGEMRVGMWVNGTAVEHEVEPRLLLVYFLRETLGLTGTNVGCDTSSCGACTVLVDSESVKSCTLLAAQVDGAEVTTIEGLASADGSLHPVQRSFREHHGLQCGYCTPGMVMAAVSLLAESPFPTESEVRTGLEGNLCRCTGYHNIVRSVLAAANALALAHPPAGVLPAGGVPAGGVRSGGVPAGGVPAGGAPAGGVPAGGASR